MLIYYSQHTDQQDEFGVSIGTLMISIGLAVGHFSLEILQLSFEAEAAGTTLGNYFVVCFAGKLGWTPFIENIKAMGSLAQRDEI